MIFRAFTGLAMVVSVAVMVLGVALMLDTDNRSLDVLLLWAIGLCLVLTTSVLVWQTRQQELSGSQE